MTLMVVTGAGLAGREQNLRQVQRLVASTLLHGSESLCKLLRYLVEHTSDNPGSPVKEYQIATEVFGRPGDFDPRLDSTVRVQTGRLRSKLAEYYAGAGAEDPIVIEIPKGSYAVTCHARAPAAVGPPSYPDSLPEALVLARDPVTVEPTQAFVAPRAVPRGFTLVMLASSAALLLALVVIAYLAIGASKGNTTTASADSTSAPYRHFWKGFIDSTEQPWVVFSNAEFVGRPETGMKYYDSRTDSKDHILDLYTGVGEVLGIHELDRVFSSLSHGLRVKRGRLLALDDAKHHDLIFVGSPFENLSLLEIPNTQDFVFRRVDAAPRKGDLSIVNVHPRSGEQKVFYASPAMPLMEDYGLVALVPGMNPAHWVMLLAGTTTIGTQAAVEYACRAASVNELLQKLNGSSAHDVVPFEAVLHVKISRGVPVQTQLVAVHAR